MSLKNAWYGLIGREKAPDARANHVFTEKDRDLSADIRDMRQESRLLREKMALLEQRQEYRMLKAELAEYDDSEDDSEENTEDKLLMQLLGMIKGKAGDSSITPEGSPTPANPPAPNLTDDEIRNFIKQQDKKKIKFAKTLPKEILKTQVKQNFNLNDVDAEKAYQILLTEF